LASLVSRFDTAHVVKVQVESHPEHLTQPLHGLSIDSTVCLQEHCKTLHAFPRDSTMWNNTTRWRNSKQLPLKPKQFIILADQGMGKDFHYLKKGTKYPFFATLTHWESPVIDSIVKSGIVGVACNDSTSHTTLRHFWNTYGIHVLENP
jgi:hypothetical protein